MGQQETVAAGGALRRMVLVLAVAALMAAMMAVSAVPAMAKNVKGPDGGEPNSNFGGAANSAGVAHCSSGSEDLNGVVVGNHGAKGVGGRECG